MAVLRFQFGDPQDQTSGASQDASGFGSSQSTALPSNKNGYAPKV